MSCCCRKFLRRHIQQYLQKHMHLPPKSVVLVATLRSNIIGRGAPATKADAEQRLQSSQVSPRGEVLSAYLLKTRYYLRMNLNVGICRGSR